MKELWKRSKELLSGQRGRTVLLVCGVVGIALLALPEILPKSESQPVGATTDAAAFVKQTEERLCGLIGRIEGAGACEVMVTLENGVEYVYATEERSNSDREEDKSGGDTRLTERDDSERSTVLIDTDTGREGLIVTEIQPTIRGVVVVCEGGDREEVRERVLAAVTVALSISSKRVCITKLS